jgi:FAD/FMN-containing dehydrogenase
VAEEGAAGETGALGDLGHRRLREDGAMPGADRLLDEIAAAVGTGNLLSDPELTLSYGTPWAARAGVAPLAVVQPADAEEVAAVLAICSRQGQPLVPQGGNTGLVRGAAPRASDLVLSAERMDAIEEIDPVGLGVVAGAGVTLEALQARLAAEGLELALDLAARSQATLGGMAATNAGGGRAFRHGTMRTQVAGVEAVLAGGERIERLGGVVKDATGYDWPSLLVGSEGTLALITRLRLRLRRLERSRAVALLAVGSVAEALALAVALRDRPTGLEAAEFVLPGALRLVCAELGLRPPPGTGDDKVLVLFEARAAGGAQDLLVEALAEHPVAAEAVVVEGAQSEELWRYREGLGEVLTRVDPLLKLDVSLPLTSLASGLEAIERAARETGGAAVEPFLFGHLLDGNVHVNLGGVEPDRVTAVTDAVLSAVLGHGGALGAEHGVGRAKAEWLGRDRGAGEIEAMRRVKAALDPAGILNPGVLFPAP